MRPAGRRWRRVALEALEPRQLLAGDIVTGLAHHWKFDEMSGDTAQDSVPSGTDATLLNWAAGEPKWEAGRIGGALRFDTADNAVVATPPAMSGSYAVSFWLNAKDRSGINARVLTARANNVIFVNNENNNGVSFNVANDVRTVSPGPPTFNTWEHYTINFNAATGQGVIYRGGAPVAIGAYFDSASLTTWVIGHPVDLSNNENTHRGALDDLRVYDRVLTDEDIAILASQGTPEPTHQEPVHHWTFDETTGNTAHDVAGGADATLLNWGPAEPKWAAGHLGGALQFSTTDDAVVTPPLGTHGRWSIAFWVNLTSLEGLYPRIVGPSDGRDLWSYIELETDRGMAFTSRNQFTISQQSPVAGVWEHYAINYDTVTDTGTIYRNGEQVAAGLFADNSPVQPWVMGHVVDLGNHNGTLNGLLDDLRVYDRLLTSSEILALADVDPPVIGPPAMMLGVTAGDVLVRFASDAPETILGSAAITGLSEGESIFAIDYRPATGEIFGLGSKSRLYTIHPLTGVATQRGSPFPFNIRAERGYGMDVNPVTDEIRITSNWGENFRLDPDDGTLIGTDTELAYVAGDPGFGINEYANAVAYSNNFAGATTTTLYDIDTSQNVLARQGGEGVPPGFPSPSSGQLTRIGPLGVNPTDDATQVIAGFDIQTLTDGTNIGYAALTTDGQRSKLYSINLATGGATLIGNIGASPTLLRSLTTASPIAISKRTYGTDYNAAPGRIVAIGSTVTLTYVVNNMGSVPLAGVAVTDDNGTPANAADDIVPTFAGGDANANGLLDPTETFTYTAGRVVGPGLHSSLAKATGTPAGGAPVTARDPEHQFGISATTLVGTDASGKLLLFDSLNPGVILNAATISGLVIGESLVGIDFRPATGELFGVSSQSRVYTLNPLSGVATLRGGPFPFNLQAGRVFGVDFNPVTDEIRVISNFEENIRLNPSDGSLAGIDTPLKYVAGDPNFGLSENPVAVAHSNNVAGAASTTLFNINTFRDVLARQGGIDVPVGSPSPNSGEMVTIGPLGIDPTEDQTLVNAAFDIHTLPSGTNVGFASLTVDGEWSRLYAINLATGAATLIGNIGPAPTLLVGLAAALTTFGSHPWHNDARALDVDNSGEVSPLDALMVINYLNAGFPTTVAATAPVGGGPGFLDTSRNNEVEPLDALLVINALNARLSGSGEGMDLAEENVGGKPDFAELLALLAEDSAGNLGRRRRG